MEYYGNKVEINKTQYMNGRLAIQLISKVEGTEHEDEYEMEDTITVNLPYYMIQDEENCAFIDTNNYPDIELWLIENKIAEPYQNITAKSGWCTYPLYKFN